MKIPLPLRFYRLALAGVIACIVPANAEIVINELMMHPAAIDGVEPVEREFIELWNRSEHAIDLTAWQFDRGIRFTFPSFTLEPGAFVLVTADPTQHDLPDNVTVFGPWDGRLSNRGETIRLVDRQGEIVDRLRYADEGDWAIRRQVPVSGQAGWEWIAPFDGDGYSLELVNPDLPNGHGQNWRPSATLGGSPGKANSRLALVSAPLISEVNHHPAVPSSREPVTIRARITSMPGTSPVVEVRFRVNTTAPGAFTAIPMSPNAQGLHTSEVPPHPEGTVIEFFIAASAGGETRTWPAPSEDSEAQEANALYQVDDGKHDGDQPEYRVVMSVAEDLAFQPGRFPSRSNAQMNATFIALHEGSSSVRYQAGIRHRGNGSRNRNPRSYRISLPRDAPWNSTTDLNLVSQYSYLQVLGMHLFKAARLPAPEAVFVQLRLNGINYANETNRFGVHYGSYAHIQPLNGVFIDDAFPDDDGGDVYKKANANPRRDEKRWGVHFDNQIVYTSPGWYHDDRWTKETNSAANDWSRFQAFIVTMNEASPERYFQEVSTTINVGQWVRWFALMNLMNNIETNLSNGIDDDYSIYQGNIDPRIVLLPHDLDTIFGLGDTDSSPDATIFQAIDAGFARGAATIPQLEPFFNDPVIRPLYFQAMHDFINSVLDPGWFDPFVHSLLSHVPSAERDRIVDFNRQRRQHVTSIIDAPVSVSATGVFQVGDSDSVQAINESIDLQGTVSPRLTTAVFVNGRTTTFDRGRGTWRMDSYELTPGLNPLRVHAVDDQGRLVSSASLRVHYPGEISQTLSGILETDVTLTASQSPYFIPETLTVPQGATLTLESGAALHFAAGARLLVRGHLFAQGQEARPINFSGRDGVPWNGVIFEGTTESRLSHVIWSGVDENQTALTLTNSSLHGDHLDFASMSGLCIRLLGASITLKDSIFPQRQGTISLLIDGGLLAGFPLELHRNQLGSVIIGERPDDDVEGITFVDNAFAGTETGAVIEGRARLVGNHFQAHSTGIFLAAGSQILVADQRFGDVDVVLRYAGPAKVTMEHVLVDGTEQLFAGSSEAELEAFVANSIFTSVDEALSPELGENSLVRFTHTLMSSGLVELLAARTDTVLNAMVRETEPALEEGFRLPPGSPARHAGTHGQDLGLTGRDRAAVFNAPLEQTPRTSFLPGITGSGWEGLDYRLDGGPWESLAIPWFPAAGFRREVPLPLTDLSPGAHGLEIREREGAAITEIHWRIDPGVSGLILNEVAAINVSEPFANGFPDWIELHNRSERPIDLTGYHLRDGGNNILPLSAGDIVEADAFLTIALVSTQTSGLALNRDGESIALLDSSGTVIDEVVFGRQLPNYTLGRLPAGPAIWGLCLPTPGTPNLRAAYAAGDDAARLNEWYAASGTAFEDDFVELVSLAPWPIDLGGLALSDSTRTAPDKFLFPPHFFLAPGDFPVITASDLGFRLNAWFESLALLQPSNGEIIDQVFWQGQDPTRTSGRVPDGTGSWIPLSPGSPEISNGVHVSLPEETVLVAWESNWHYYQEETPLINAWIEPDFSDTGWEVGTAALFRENSDIAISKNTPLALNPPYAHAFRQKFFVEDPAVYESLTLSLLVDDGAVAYLNGEELLKQRMPDIFPTPLSTFATDGVSNAVIEGPFPVDTGRLRPGENLLAVSVHQDDTTSSDVVFAAQLSAVVKDPNAAVRDEIQDLLTSFRLTEFMFHPAGDDASEWLEFTNTGGETLQLEGLRFSAGLTFTFPAMTLAPNERVVVVSNEAAFRRDYGDGIAIAGVFQGRLDNAGETLALQLPAPAEHQVLAFRYEPDWYPETNGGGRSLVVRQEERLASSEREDWRAGDVPGGTPGAPELPVIYSVPPTGSVLQESLLYQLEATQGATSYGAIGLPQGLMIDEETGLISGSPEEFGNFDVILMARNVSGETSRLWRLAVAASDPVSRLVWETVPDTVSLDEPFTLVVRAQDNQGRRAQDMEGTMTLQASAARGAGPPVVISEIRDFSGGADGLTITKTDPDMNTAGWRLLLNAAADRDIDAIHGIGGVVGQIVELPAHFTRLEVSDNELGFNILWSDAPPDQRPGGQRGWALIVNRENEAIDFVAWGYSEEQLTRWSPRDETGAPVERRLWNGPGVPHPGELGLTLARSRAIDSDTMHDWEWIPQDDVREITGPVMGREPLPLSILEDHGFIAGRWQGTVEALGFGSEIYLEAVEITTGLSTGETVFSVLPPGPPELPETEMNLQAVAGQRIALPALSAPLAETLEIDGPAPQVTLFREDRRTIARISEPGNFTVPIAARNSLGTSRVSINFTVLPDGDDDGLADEWETRYGLDPTWPDDALGDLDDDGTNNLAEFAGGTNPLDPASRIFIETIDRLDDAIRLSWTAVPRGVYTVELGRRSSAHGLTWGTAHPGWIVAGENDVNASIVVPLSELAIDGSQWLRVRVWQNGR